MSEVDDQVIAKLKALHHESFEHTEGFTCFRQFTLETSGLDPELLENWIAEHGGHLKHIRIPADENIGRSIPQPDSEPVYFVPSELLA